MPSKTSGFRWVVPPRTLAKQVGDYGVAIKRAVLVVADKNGQAMQNYARKEAPWTDRTGNARTGIFYVIEEKPSSVIIYLAHSVEYGIYLELAMAGRYEIIWPTILLALARIQADLKEVLAGRGIRKGASYRKPKGSP